MKVTKRMERFRAAYLGEARGSGSEAARIAGYKHPAQAFHVLAQRVPDWIEGLRKDFNEALIMRGREIDERLTALARDPTHRDHYKALELLAKMSGKLKEQLVVVNRQQLNSELDELIATLREQRTDSTLRES